MQVRGGTQSSQPHSNESESGLSAMLLGVASSDQQLQMDRNQSQPCQSKPFLQVLQEARQNQSMTSQDRSQVIKSLQSQFLKDQNTKILEFCNLDENTEASSNQLSNMCEECVQAQEFETKQHLIDFTLLALDYTTNGVLNTLRSQNQSSIPAQPENNDSFQKMEQIGKELYFFIDKNKDDILTDYAQNQTLEKLLDLVLLADVTCLASFTSSQSLSHSQNPYNSQNSAFLTVHETKKQILDIIDQLSLNQQFNTQNSNLSLAMKPQGLFSSLHAITQLHFYNQQQQEQEDLEYFLAQTERIIFKLLSSPMLVHQSCMTGLLSGLLIQTDNVYHIDLLKGFFELVEQLYNELKRGKQEPFKKKVLAKLNQCIAMVILQKDIEVLQWVIERLGQMVCKDDGKQSELAYLIFTSIDGKWFNSLQNSPLILKVVDQLLQQNLKYIDAKSKDETLTKSATLKQLIYFLQPLNDLREHIQPHHLANLKQIIKLLQVVFPMKKVAKHSAPYSLLEIYYNLFIIVYRNPETQKLQFDHFYQLFTSVKNTLPKSDQNQLIMHRLVVMQPSISLPEEDKQHFYDEFGSVLKCMLSQKKDFALFFLSLKHFMEWAGQTELQDLNFSVPENDLVVQQMIEQHMQNEGIIPQNESTQTEPIECAIYRDIQKAQKEIGMKDCEIMEKFCKVNSSHSNESLVQPIEPVPELAIKLIECEYMIRGKTEVPDTVFTQLYQKFKTELPQADITKFREFLSRQDFEC